jgi:hypothetical protein
MVKKIRIVFPLVMMIGLVLSACSSSPTAQTSAAAAPTAAAQTNNQGKPAAPAGATPAVGGQTAQQAPGGSLMGQSQLAVGTLKLEGTDQAVTAEQAKTLLPLWQEVKTLQADTSTTSEQLQAAYQKIKDNMTSDQVQAIEKTTLTQDDLQSLASKYGVEMPSAPGGGQGNGPAGTPMAPGGGAPGGNPAAPAGGTPGAGGNPPDFQGTPGAGGRMGRGMDTLFLDPLIKLLQERAGA